MRTRLLLAFVLLVVAAPVALAQEPATPPAEPCTDAVTEQRALDALREALRDPLPPRAGQTVKVKVTPCAPGRLVLRVRRNTKTGTLLAEADRTLRSTATATLRLRTTKAIERYRGKRLRLDLRAIFLP